MFPMLAGANAFIPNFQKICAKVRQEIGSMKVLGTKPPKKTPVADAWVGHGRGLMCGPSQLDKSRIDNPCKMQGIGQVTLIFFYAGRPPQKHNIEGALNHLGTCVKFGDKKPRQIPIYLQILMIRIITAFDLTKYPTNRTQVPGFKWVENYWFDNILVAFSLLNKAIINISCTGTIHDQWLITHKVSIEVNFRFTVGIRRRAKVRLYAFVASTKT
jgi:hypothetical protein